MALGCCFHVKISDFRESIAFTCAIAGLASRAVTHLCECSRAVFEWP
jgi:hypothetical protein